MEVKTLRWSSFDIIRESSLVVCGCSLIVLGTFLKIPCYPVSFTMQTYFLFAIALTFPEKAAFKSALLFLILASIGAPVFAGKAQALWLFGKCGGYLIAFPIAVYIASYFKNTPLKGLFFGHLAIYTLGFIGLLHIFSPLDALIKGVLIFIPSDILKASFIYFGTKHEHH